MSGVDDMASLKDDGILEIRTRRRGSVVLSSYMRLRLVTMKKECFCHFVYISNILLALPILHLSFLSGLANLIIMPGMPNSEWLYTT